MTTAPRMKISLLLIALTAPTLAVRASARQAIFARQASGTSYQAKFPGDPAHSDSEAAALGYMRVVLRAQRQYKRRHQHFASSLAQLAGTNSFTKRMARSNDRGDYVVEFRAKLKEDSFQLSMIPKQYDDQHRAFFASDDGMIRVEEGKPATQESPKLK